jgi:hypothetical protein
MEYEFVEEPEVLFTIEVDQKIAKDGRYTFRATKVSVETSCNAEGFEKLLDGFLKKAVAAVGKGLSKLKENEPEA